MLYLYSVGSIAIVIFMEKIPELTTVGVIAKALGITNTKVEYIIKSRNIQPRAKAGNVWVYPPEVVDQIKAALSDIARRH